MMAKRIGYTFCIRTRKPTDTFVFCKWLVDLNEAIAYAVGELKDRAHYDVDFILIREGTTGSTDPVQWDSRKDYKPEPVISPIRAKVTELYNQNNFDTDTFEQLISVLDEMEKCNGLRLLPQM